MTMRDSDNRDHRDLEAALAAARTAQPQPSADLLSRIMADAEAVQPAPVPQAPRRSGLWPRTLAVLGGWRPVGGLATAAVAGLMIGYSDTGGLVTQPASLWSQTEGAEMAGLIPDDGFFDLALGAEG